MLYAGMTLGNQKKTLGLGQGGALAEIRIWSSVFKLPRDHFHRFQVQSIPNPM